MHTGPTPSVSPKSNQQNPTPSPNLLPRWNSSDGRDSFFYDDTINSGGTGIGNSTDTALTSNLSSIDQTQFGSSFPSQHNTFDSSNNVSSLARTQSLDNDNLVNPQYHQSQDIVELISSTHTLKTKFVIGVTEKSLNTLKSTARTQISILKQGMYCS